MIRTIVLYVISVIFAGCFLALGFVLAIDYRAWLQAFLSFIASFAFGLLACWASAVDSRRRWPTDPHSAANVDS